MVMRAFVKYAQWNGDFGTLTHNKFEVAHCHNYKVSGSSPVTNQKEKKKENLGSTSAFLGNKLTEPRAKFSKWTLPT